MIKLFKTMMLGSALLLFAGACRATEPLQGEMPRGQEVPAEAREAVIDSCSIVFLGNSLTHGGKWNELFGITNAVNRGIVGNTALDIDARLAEVTEGRPAKIFLMCGVNDVSHDLTADSVATDVIHLVDRILAETPGTKLYLQSLLPINNSFGRYKRVVGKEQTIRDINIILEKKAAERGVTWVFLYDAFCDEDLNLRKELTTDGLHLTAPGYEIWRDRLMPYVRE